MLSGLIIGRMLIRSLLLGLLVVIPLAHASAESLQQLVRDAAYNEAQAHKDSTAWKYRIDKRTDGRLLTEEQVDSADGPVFQLFAIDGKALNAQQQKDEAARIEKIEKDLSLQKKIRQRHLADEQRLNDLLKLLPKAFLFHLVRTDGDIATVRFQPNPQFHSSGYEERVMRALEGELMINRREKRIAHLRGRLTRDIKFGFGILGRVDEGGVFELGRVEVLPGVWKTNQITIQISGQFSFFTTLSKDQSEARSEFVRVPKGLSVKQAYTLLENTR